MQDVFPTKTLVFLLGDGVPFSLPSTEIHHKSPLPPTARSQSTTELHLKQRQGLKTTGLLLQPLLPKPRGFCGLPRSTLSYPSWQQNTEGESRRLLQQSCSGRAFPSVQGQRGEEGWHATGKERSATESSEINWLWAPCPWKGRSHLQAPPGRERGLVFKSIYVLVNCNYLLYTCIKLNRSGLTNQR